MKAKFTKKTVVRILFFIWCLCASLALYGLFSPWAEVVTTAGLIALFVLFFLSTF